MAGEDCFGAPGSVPTVLVMLLFPTGIFLLSRLIGRKVMAAVPLLVLVTVAVSAVVFGMSGFWPCHDKRRSTKHGAKVSILKRWARA